MKKEREWLELLERRFEAEVSSVTKFIVHPHDDSVDPVIVTVYRSPRGYQVTAESAPDDPVPDPDKPPKPYAHGNPHKTLEGALYNFMPHAWKVGLKPRPRSES